MVAKRHIQNNLQQIDNLYRKSKSPKKGLFYCKLAIIELCGWIEESMDDIVRHCAKRYVREPENMRFVEQSIIGRTYGFEYERHFRNMLIQVMGIIDVERLERQLDPVKLQLMQSALETLKKCRDSEAHTHLKGATKTLDAPSITESRFLMVYEGLKDIENHVTKLKL